MSKLPCVSLFHLVSYVSAKYYLNWFTVGNVIAKNKKGEVFIKTQCRNIHRLIYTNIFAEIQ